MIRAVLEKLPHDDGGSGVRIQLAHAGDDDGPSDTIEEADGFTVESPKLGPELDGAEGESERCVGRDEAEDGVGITGT